MKISDSNETYITKLNFKSTMNLSLGKCNRIKLSEKARMENLGTKWGEWWECKNQGGNAGNSGGNHFTEQSLKNEIVKVKHIKPIQENSKNSIYK